MDACRAFPSIWHRLLWQRCVIGIIVVGKTRSINLFAELCSECGTTSASLALIPAKSSWQLELDCWTPQLGICSVHPNGCCTPASSSHPDLAPKGGCCIGMQEQHMLLFLKLRHELQLPGTTEHCLCEYEKTKRWMAAFDKRWPGMHLPQALVQDGAGQAKRAVTAVAARKPTCIFFLH